MTTKSLTLARFSRDRRGWLARLDAVMGSAQLLWLLSLVLLLEKVRLYPTNLFIGTGICSYVFDDVGLSQPWFSCFSIIKQEEMVLVLVPHLPEHSTHLDSWDSLQTHLRTMLFCSGATLEDITMVCEQLRIRHFIRTSSSWVPVRTHFKLSYLG